MSKNGYLLYCAVIIGLATLINLSMDDDGGSYRSSSGYYGSGFGSSGGHK